MSHEFWLKVRPSNNKTRHTKGSVVLVSSAHAPERVYKTIINIQSNLDNLYTDQLVISP